MPDLPPENPTQLALDKSQATLADFLRADLDLAFTLLRIVEIDAKDDPEHSRTALANAREVLRVVRMFEDRLKDAEVRKEIHKRADELKSAIAVFEPAQ